MTVLSLRCAKIADKHRLNTYNRGSSVSYNPSSGTIIGASDVTTSNLSSDDLLVYDQATGKWGNRQASAIAQSVGRTAYPVASNVNGSWPTFESVYPSAILPLPLTSEVKWYVASDESSATIPSQFEDINATTRTIGGLHSLWGYPIGATTPTTTIDVVAKIGQNTNSTWGTSAVTNYSSTAGNTLVLAVSSLGSNTITDTAGNTWTLLADTTAGSTDGQSVGQVYYCINAAAVTSVTLARATNSTMAISLTEWSNVAEMRNFTVGGSGAASVQATTGDLVMGSMFHFSASGTPAATPSGYAGLTPVVNGTFVNDGAYKIATTTGLQDIAWTPSDTGEVKVAFRPTVS